jgi:16S rRNA (adenine1518-N6/adenine1519-N6)-dimethyltransferase
MPKPPNPPDSNFSPPLFDRLSRKRFGQHWLINESVLNNIVAAANLVEGDRVLEIGPGTGSLTQRILPSVQSLVSVEIDRDLCKLLRQHYAEAENFLLLEQDILETDLQSSLADFPLFQTPNKVVANIPYNITGPILEKLLGKIATPNPQPFDSIVLLLQKEVAERVCAVPHSKAFGALTVRVQYLAAPEWICDVPAKSFQPAPKVDSAVVRLVPRVFEPAARQPKQLETYVKLGFATKRKMLRNNLKSLIDRDRLTALLEMLNLDPQVRAEDLSVTDWVNLCNQLDAQTN